MESYPGPEPYGSRPRQGKLYRYRGIHGLWKLDREHSERIWKHKKRQRYTQTNFGLFNQRSQPFIEWGCENENYKYYKRFQYWDGFEGRYGSPLMFLRGQQRPKERPILWYLRQRRELKPKQQWERYSSKPQLLFFEQWRMWRFRPDERPSQNKHQMDYESCYPYQCSFRKRPHLLPRQQECLRQFEHKPLKPNQENRSYKWERTNCWTYPNYSSPRLIKTWDKLAFYRIPSTQKETWKKRKHYRLKPELFEERNSHGDDWQYIGQRNQNYENPKWVLKQPMRFERIFRSRKKRQTDGEHRQRFSCKLDSDGDNCFELRSEGYRSSPNRTQDGSERRHQNQLPMSSNHSGSFRSHFRLLIYILLIFKILSGCSNYTLKKNTKERFS